jgi:hypothetical protein
MAGKKITELEELMTVQNDDYLTMVDSDETVVTNINKKISVESFVTFLRNESIMFPVPFAATYLDTKANGLTINGQPDQTRNISNLVSNKTVNLGDISVIKFDAYGRVWDAVVKPDVKDVFIASGTAASYYKSTIEDEGIAGPTSFDNVINDTNKANGGYFNKDTYYWPNDYGTLVNYSDGVSNQNKWTNLFMISETEPRTYTTYDRTFIEITYSYADADTNFNPQPGNATIDINWEDGSLKATGSFPSYDRDKSQSINFPAVWSTSSLTGDNTSYSATIQGAGSLLCVPQILINYNLRQITGLPIPTILDNQDNVITNQSIAVNVVITNE